jgi:hypothetical protein
MNENLLLFREAVYWKYSYHMSNPDVGMPPSIKDIAQDILNKTGFEISQVELNLIVFQVKNKYDGKLNFDYI